MCSRDRRTQYSIFKLSLEINYNYNEFSLYEQYNFKNHSRINVSFQIEYNRYVSIFDAYLYFYIFQTTEEEINIVKINYYKKLIISRI